MVDWRYCADAQPNRNDEYLVCDYEGYIMTLDYNTDKGWGVASKSLNDDFSPWEEEIVAWAEVNRPQGMPLML